MVETYSFRKVVREVGEVGRLIGFGFENSPAIVYFFRERVDRSLATRLRGREVDIVSALEEGVFLFPDSVVALSCDGRMVYPVG